MRMQSVQEEILQCVRMTKYLVYCIYDIEIFNTSKGKKNSIVCLLVQFFFFFFWEEHKQILLV